MKCSKCEKVRLVEDFSIRNHETKRRHRICKFCHSKYRKEHYLRNKLKYIEKARSWNDKQRSVLETFLYERLSQSHCVDCFEKDILVLDFDHLYNKRFGIALMFKNRYSVAAIEDEIEKCVVRCANCHRRKTAKEVGYWKSRILDKIGA